MKITNIKVEMFNWKSEPWMTGVGTAFGQDAAAWHRHRRNRRRR